MSMAIDESALHTMRQRSRPGTFWAVYENVAMDSANAGHLQFLQVGAGCTFGEPPPKYPMDNAHGMGWRYCYCGNVDLEAGTVLETT